MKQLLITLLILLSFTSCQDQETEAKIQAQRDAKIAAQARADLLAEIAQQEAAASQNEHYKHLQHMGINIKKDVISIDTNKSKIFLKNFSDKMARHVQKASDDLEKGIIETKEAGIDINNEHIHIDLNKTKNFLQEWSVHIKGLVDEMNQVTKQLEDNTSH